MLLRGPERTRRRVFAGSMVIVLAIAVLGLTGGQRAAAQFDPRGLLDVVKKKGATADPKKNVPNVLSGKKDAGKTAVTPKNLPNLGKGLPVNLGSNQPGKGLPGNLGN